MRSYFSGDTRRKVPQLLRETETIEHRVCAHPLEAAVRELRLIQELEPRFNRRAKAWRSYAYLRLTLPERFPRLSVVRAAPADAGLHVGPLPSVGAARALRDAVETAVPLRRCRRLVGRRAVLGGPPCLAAQLHVAACPCSGLTSPAEYATIVETAARALTGEPAVLLDPLERRMAVLADARRFEDAAVTRDQLAAIRGAVERQRLVDGLREAGRLVVAGPDGDIEIVDGRLVLPDDAPTLASTSTVGRSRPATRSTSCSRSPGGCDAEAATLRPRLVTGTLASRRPPLVPLRGPASASPLRGGHVEVVLEVGGDAAVLSAHHEPAATVDEGLDEQRGGERPDHDDDEEGHEPGQGVLHEHVEQLLAGEVAERAGGHADDDEADGDGQHPGADAHPQRQRAAGRLASRRWGRRRDPGRRVGGLGGVARR